MPSSAEDVLILDGGMGRELQAMGAPFRQPEWSALALIEARAMRCACGRWKTECDLSLPQAPEKVAYAHAAFVQAGADVITTNSYALVPYHIGEARFTKGAPRKPARLLALPPCSARRDWRADAAAALLLSFLAQTVPR